MHMGQGTEGEETGDRRGTEGGEKGTEGGETGDSERVSVYVCTSNRRRSAGTLSPTDRHTVSPGTSSLASRCSRTPSLTLAQAKTSHDQTVTHTALPEILFSPMTFRRHQFPQFFQRFF